MILFLYIFILAFGGAIFYNRGERRLELFLLAVIFIPDIPYPTSGVSSHRFFILAFWASVVYYHEIGKIKRNALLLFLVFILLSYYLTGINDNRLTSFSKFWKPSIHFITEYAMFLLGALTLFTKKKWIRFRVFIINVSLVVCGYGLLTAMLGADPYSQGIASVLADKAGCDFTPLGVGRHRICSFLYNSHLFGYFCTLMTILLTYFHLKAHFSTKERICFFLVICGLFLSGSRSSLIAALMGVVVIFLFGVRINTMTRYALIFMLALFPISQLPFVQKSVESVSVILSDDDSKQMGSSINMRQNQLMISMLYFSNNPVLGNGIDYYAEVVKPDDMVIKRLGLYGAESYVFILLIERGIIQIVAIILFCIAIIIHYYRNLRACRLESAVGMAIFLSFVLISITTGNSGKWEFALPLVGLFYNYKCNLIKH